MSEPREEAATEPWYEVEDCGCACWDANMHSEWEWSPEDGCYVCQGCGETQ